MNTTLMQGIEESTSSRPPWRRARLAGLLVLSTHDIVAYLKLVVRHRRNRRELLTLDLDQLTDAGISQEALVAALKFPPWCKRGGMK